MGDSSDTVMVDATGNADGTYVNTPTLGTTGLIVNDVDTAVDFNGTDQYATAPTIAITSEITLECWFKTDSAAGSGTGAFLVAKTQSGGNGYDWGIFETNGRNISFHVNTTTNGVNSVSIPDTEIITGTPYHIVGTYDGVTLRVYLNGVEYTSSAVSDTIVSTGSYGLVIGVRNDASFNYFDGTIDEVAMESEG